MNRTTTKILGLLLAIVVTAGASAAIPAAYAGTKKVSAEQVVIAEKTLSPADQAKLVTLKTLYKQIAEAARAVRTKVKAARAAGKDLTAFAADLKTAQKDATHKAVSRGVMLTEAERAQLVAMQASLRTLEQQLKAQRKAKATQAVLDAVKTQIKAATAARTAYLKTIHAAALAQYSARLDTLIANANAKLAFLQGLLARLP